MNTLVIIPSLHHKYSFSAPLAWLFGEHSMCVRGIYSEDLHPKDLWGIELCIVELNWFVELCEFQHIVAFIRRYRPEAKILFGGLYGQLKYRDIFERCEVDYFIKGFAELPIKLLLEGQNPRNIPNMLGRDFENETTYVPSQDDLRRITYNLDWFPDYFRYWSMFPAPGVDAEPDFSGMPLRPSYRYSPRSTEPLKQFRVPFRGGRYHLPMVITARGRCRAVHEGCSDCMGSKFSELKRIYGCDGIVLDNETLKLHLRQIASRFTQVTLYINSPFEYDFAGEQYELDATIEVDCAVTPSQLRSVLSAFSRAKVHLVLNGDGHRGRPGVKALDFASFLDLQDECRRIYFFAFRDDARVTGLPSENRLYSEYVFPKWASWDFYTDWDKATRYSRRWFALTRQYNLLPFPRSLFMRLGVGCAFRAFYIASRLGIRTGLKEEMLFGDRV